MVEFQCPDCKAQLPARSAVCLRCNPAHKAPTDSNRTSRRGKHLLERLTTSKVPVFAFSGGTNTSATSSKKNASIAVAETTSVPNKRSHHKPQLKFIIPALLLGVVLVAVGIYVIRINMAFNTINSISTPSGELSGEALGGASDLKIDTSPAKTAIAAGGGSAGGGKLAAAVVPAESTKTTTSAAIEPTTSPTSTVVPPSVSPTGTSIQPTPATTETPVSTEIAIPPTETPTVEPALPTATPPVLSEIERIKNGDFEMTDSSWYLEQGVTVDTGDAHGGTGLLKIDKTGGYADQQVFFVAGTTYQVTAWAKLSTGKAEDAQVGINFVDENGAALSAGVPAPLAIDGTKWTELTFSYSPPEGTAAVRLYFWKPAGTATLSVDDVSVRSVVTEKAMSADIRPSDPGSMTILLMGVDARPGEAIDIGVRPDSLMVLHLSSESGSCRLLSIPRDTRTELPGYGMTKVNHALAVGGIDYAKQVVEQLLGIEIDHYVLIDFNGFEDMVDAVGGITVDVPEPFVSDDGREFVVGEQEMTGTEALSYSRWRGGSDGDFGRMQRQQLVLRALVAKTSGLNVVKSINELLPAVVDNLRTDLSPTEMASIAMDYRSRCTASTISMIRLEGSAATYDDPLLHMPLYYIEVDEAEIRSKVAALFEP